MDFKNGTKKSRLIQQDEGKALHKKEQGKEQELYQDSSSPEDSKIQDG